MPRLLGVELYFDDVERAKRFYRDTIGLELSDEASGHFAQFACGGGFVCVESKGTENYPSHDKAVVFLEVPDLQAMVDRIGRDHVVHLEVREGKQSWAVVHDPEGHNVLLLEA
ncbi:MAG TPA: VOC family protein [Gemmatimonadaceae bacterium]|jgi:predicted enzyme related to lactoylglutathione lyase|nr:VOC family protein [Gemmatimonadaceae bacterium]